MIKAEAQKKRQQLARAILFCYLLSRSGVKDSIETTMAVIDYLFNYFDNGGKKC